MSITGKLCLIMMLASANASCIVIVSELSKRTQEIQSIDNNAILPGPSPAGAGCHWNRRGARHVGIFTRGKGTG